MVTFLLTLSVVCWARWLVKAYSEALVRSFRFYFSERKTDLRIQEFLIRPLANLTSSEVRHLAAWRLQPWVTPSLLDMKNRTECKAKIGPVYDRETVGNLLIPFNLWKLNGRIPAGGQRLRNPPHVITMLKGFSFTAAEKCLLWLLIKTCETTWA